MGGGGGGCGFFFFFNDTATTEIYTLSLHDALPICEGGQDDFIGREEADRLGIDPLFRCRDLNQARHDHFRRIVANGQIVRQVFGDLIAFFFGLQLAERSEEHTSELQSLTNLVCRLLLEKKKNKTNNNNS